MSRSAGSGSGSAPGIAGAAATLLLILATPAAAQEQEICPGLGRYTVASCGEDTCSCASPCVRNEDCNSGCCANRLCALACVCNADGGAPVVPVDAGCTPPPEIAPPGCATAASVPAVLASLLGPLINRWRRRLHGA